MFYEKGYANYVETKQTKNGKDYTSFSLSVPNGKDDEGKARYKYLHMTYWGGCSSLKNDDYIEVTGEMDEVKNNDGKREIRLSVTMLKIRGRATNVTSNSKKEEEDDIPF